MRLSDIFQKLHDDIITMRNKRGDTGLEPQVVHRIMADIRRTTGYQLCKRAMAATDANGRDKFVEVVDREAEKRGVLVMTNKPEVVKNGNIKFDDEDINVSEIFQYLDVDLLGFVKAIGNKKIFYYPHKPKNNSEVVYGKSLLSKKEDDIVKSVDEALQQAGHWLMDQRDARRSASNQRGTEDQSSGQ